MKNSDLINSDDNTTQKVSDFLNLLNLMTNDNNGFKSPKEKLFRLEDFTLEEDYHWIILAYTSSMYYRMGDLSSAKASIIEALSTNIAINNPLIRGTSLIIYCTIFRLLAELDHCSNEISEILSIGQEYDLPYFRAFSTNLRGISKYLSHNVNDAVEILFMSSHQYLSMGNKPRAALNSLYVTLWLAPQKSYNNLVKMAQNSFDIIKSSPYPTWPGIVEISQSILGAVQSESGQYSQALINLSESHKTSETNKSKQLSCGTGFHLAKLYYIMGNAEQGENYLRHSFFSASNNGYYTFYNMHFPTFLELAVRAYNMNLCREYIFLMVIKYFGISAADYFSLNATLVGAKGIPDFILAFIEKYGDLGNALHLESIHIRVTLFGQFSITINGIPIADNEWKTKKEKFIVKYLLLNMDKNVSRETLIDMFWQKYDKKSAGASLRVALSELRRLMQKYNLAADNVFPLIDEINSNLIIRKSFRIKNDFDDFNNLYLSFKKHMKTDFPYFITKHILNVKYAKDDNNRDESIEGKIENITKILENIIELYTGDLLCDDFYEDFLESIRAKYKGYFLDAAEILSLIYIRDKRMVEAESLILRIIEVDYLNEDACLKLIKLYVSSGRKSMALNLFNAFRKSFMKEMGFEPDGRLILTLREL